MRDSSGSKLHEAWTKAAEQVQSLAGSAIALPLAMLALFALSALAQLMVGN